jgi:hypothetical protein
MSTKAAFSFSQNGNTIASPFWVKPEAKKSAAKRVLKIC